MKEAGKVQCYEEEMSYGHHRHMQFNYNPNLVSTDVHCFFASMKVYTPFYDTVSFWARKKAISWVTGSNSVVHVGVKFASPT